MGEEELEWDSAPSFATALLLGFSLPLVMDFIEILRCNQPGLLRKGGNFSLCMSST